MERHGDVLAYFTHHDFLSHMHPSVFHHRGLRFPAVENFIMYGKCMTFKDYELAQQMLQTENPYDCKKLGKGVKGFDQAIWDAWSFKIALVGNRCKYFENAVLGRLLIETNPLTLAEATWNKTWGAGFLKTDSRIGDKALWTGQNKGGNCVMQIRTELINNTMSGRK